MKYLKFAIIAVAAMLTTIAAADLAVKDGNQALQTVFNFVCFTSKLCNATVIIDSSGTEKGTTGNPLQVATADGASVAAGAKADTPCGYPTTSAACSQIALLKGQLNGITSPIPDQGVTRPVIGAITNSYFNNVVSSTLTRASNTTAYAANQTVCLVTSVTVCAPLTISIATINQGKGKIRQVNLLKSGSSTTNANFTIWFFSAAPVTATPNQFDATSYTGPRAADMPNYLGNATCTSPVATSDTSAQVWYACTLSTGTEMVFQALSGATTINALISATAAYTPASAETFKVYVSGIY